MLVRARRLARTPGGLHRPSSCLHAAAWEHDIRHLRPPFHSAFSCVMGGRGARAVVVERDASEFARLSQLGDVLGLSPLEVSSVHSQLAEQAYRNQVQSVRGCALVASGCQRTSGWRMRWTMSTLHLAFV